MYLPTAAYKELINNALNGLRRALESHPLWTPPTPNPALTQAYDSLERTQYFLSELDNIIGGRDVQHPEQFTTRPGKDEAAASEVYREVVERCTLILEPMICGTAGPARAFAAMWSGAGPGGSFDYGEEAKTKMRELSSALSNRMPVSQWDFG